MTVARTAASATGRPTRPGCAVPASTTAGIGDGLKGTRNSSARTTSAHTSAAAAPAHDRFAPARISADLAPTVGPTPITTLTIASGAPTLVDEGAEPEICPPGAGTRMKYFTPLAATHLIDAFVLVIAAPITNFAPEPTYGA